MNRDEFRAAIGTLKSAGTDIGEALGVSSAKVSQWERGASRVPRIRARQIKWLLKANEDRERRAAAALPHCDWADGLTERYQERLTATAKGAGVLEAVEAYTAEMDEHRSRCPTCSSNQEWEDRHLSNLGPFPMPGLIGFFMGIFGRVPQQFHYALLGGLFLGGIVALRLAFLVVVVVFRFPGVAESLRLLGGGVTVVVAASAAGAAGGLVIPLTAPLRRTMGMMGDYLTGVLVMEAYMWSIAGILPLAVGGSAIGDMGGWKSLSLFAAGFGLAGAFMHRRNQKKDRKRTPMGTPQAG